MIIISLDSMLQGDKLEAATQQGLRQLLEVILNDHQNPLPAAGTFILRLGGEVAVLVDGTIVSCTRIGRASGAMKVQQKHQLQQQQQQQEHEGPNSDMASRLHLESQSYIQTANPSVYVLPEEPLLEVTLHGHYLNAPGVAFIVQHAHSNSFVELQPDSIDLDGKHATLHVPFTNSSPTGLCVHIPSGKTVHKNGVSNQRVQALHSNPGLYWASVSHYGVITTAVPLLLLHPDDAAIANVAPMANNENQPITSQEDWTIILSAVLAKAKPAVYPNSTLPVSKELVSQWARLVLLSACNVGDSDVVAMMLPIVSNAVCNPQTGRTPLHTACVDNNMGYVAWLLLAGADVHAVDKLGLTPLQLAAICGHDELFNMLEEGPTGTAAIKALQGVSEDLALAFMLGLCNTKSQQQSASSPGSSTGKTHQTSLQRQQLQAMKVLAALPASDNVLPQQPVLLLPPHTSVTDQGVIDTAWQTGQDQQQKQPQHAAPNKDRLVEQPNQQPFEYVRAPAAAENIQVQPVNHKQAVELQQALTRQLACYEMHQADCDVLGTIQMSSQNPMETAADTGTASLPLPTLQRMESEPSQSPLSPSQPPSDQDEQQPLNIDASILDETVDADASMPAHFDKHHINSRYSNGDYGNDSDSLHPVVPAEETTQNGVVEVGSLQAAHATATAVEQPAMQANRGEPLISQRPKRARQRRQRYSNDDDYVIDVDDMQAALSSSGNDDSDDEGAIARPRSKKSRKTSGRNTVDQGVGTFLKQTTGSQAAKRRTAAKKVDDQVKEKKSGEGKQPTSKFLGVTRHRRSGRWEAHIWVKEINRQVYLGSYGQEEHAAEAYDVAALKTKGAGVNTNFPADRYASLLNCMAQASLEEVIMAVRRQSQGFARGSSTYRGVTAHQPTGRWESRIGIPGSKHVYLVLRNTMMLCRDTAWQGRRQGTGLFDDEVEAAIAYDKALVRMRGNASATNFALRNYKAELCEYHEVQQALLKNDARVEEFMKGGLEFERWVKSGSQSQAIPSDANEATTPQAAGWPGVAASTADTSNDDPQAGARPASVPEQAQADHQPKRAAEDDEEGADALMFMANTA